jgi:transposase
VFIDQSGFLLNPLVRRTLAPKGHTPILTVRGRHRQKVSVMAALSLSPRQQRLGLYFRTRQDGYFQTEHVVAFLRDLHYHFRGKIIVVWDGWKVHQAAAKLVNSSRLETVTLPGYAPELNPVEQVWNRLKWSDLANAAPADSDELYRQLRPLLHFTARSLPRLLSFWKGAELPLDQLKLKR